MFGGIDHNLVSVAYVFFFFFQKGGSLYERDADWLMTRFARSNQIPPSSLIYWQQLAVLLSLVTELRRVRRADAMRRGTERCGASRRADRNITHRQQNTSMYRERERGRDRGREGGRESA